MIAKLSDVEKKTYEEKGFLVIKNSGFLEIKKNLFRELKTVSLGLLEKLLTKEEFQKIREMDFPELFHWCIANEKNNRLSRPFYEVYPAVPEVIGLVSQPFFKNFAREVGVGYPLSSCLPLLRIDRPKEERWQTPVHQDYWYSLLSPNSVTYWFSVLPVTEEMGPLWVVPGSHKAGVLPVKVWSDDNPFTTKREYADSEFVPLLLEEDETLLFHQCLVHKSGQNKSDRARLTLQLRYNDLSTIETPTTSFTVTHSRFVKDAQKKLLEESAQ